jgi:hypothetical protein
MTKFARKKIPVPRHTLLIEINNLRRWAVLADMFSDLTQTAEGRANLAALDENAAVQALRHWLAPSARAAPWGALAGQLRSMAQELEVADRRHRENMERKEYAMHYADSEWQFKNMARRLGKPTPSAVNKVVLDGEVFTNPKTVKDELEKWARVSASEAHSAEQMPAAQSAYDRWLDRANIHPVKNQAAIDRLLRPLEPWELDRQLNKKAGMAAGDDLLTWELLQDADPAARQNLYHAFATHWDRGRRGTSGANAWRYPDSLKHAWTSPIPKTGYAGGTELLRPISITNALARLYNKMIVARLTDYIESAGCLSKSQAGFRRGLNTHEPLARLEEFLEAISPTGGHVLALDLSQANHLHHPQKRIRTIHMHIHNTHIHISIHIQTHIQTNIHTHIHTHTRTDRQTDRQTDSQTGERHGLMVQAVGTGL